MSKLADINGFKFLTQKTACIAFTTGWGTFAEPLLLCGAVILFWQQAHWSCVITWHFLHFLFLKPSGLCVYGTGQQSMSAVLLGLFCGTSSTFCQSFMINSGTIEKRTRLPISPGSSRYCQNTKPNSLMCWTWLTMQAPWMPILTLLHERNQ